MIGMTLMMKMAGGTVIATWLVYLTALTALSLAGVDVERDALHAALVTLLAIGTLAYVLVAVVASGWLRQAVREAARLEQTTGSVRAASNTPTWGIDPETIAAARRLSQRAESLKSVAE